MSGTTTEMTSPVKSLSVRTIDGKSSIHRKIGDNNYKSIANYSFQIVCLVHFPKRFTYLTGYLLNVVRTDGEEM